MNHDFENGRHAGVNKRAHIPNFIPPRNSTPRKVVTVIMLKMKIPIVLVFLILTCIMKDFYAGKLSILIMMQPTGIIRPTDYTEM